MTGRRRGRGILPLKPTRHNPILVPVPSPVRQIHRNRDRRLNQDGLPAVQDVKLMARGKPVRRRPDRLDRLVPLVEDRVFRTSGRVGRRAGLRMPTIPAAAAAAAAASGHSWFWSIPPDES